MLPMIGSGFGFTLIYFRDGRILGGLSLSGQLSGIQTPRKTDLNHVLASQFVCVSWERGALGPNRNVV